ncbi:PA0069 family radical SAM protein [Pseudoprimorskyibacter insulae]|nr:PA0069 family radical SAM protein [Pseudoprimorskyibacter insulae]
MCANVVIPSDRRPGRGAASRDSGRFETFSRSDDHDGWDIDEPLPPVRTEVTEERITKAMNYVRSPDLPFDRTINPYRGCEHGCIYCFARPTHAFLGLSPGLDFETRLVARPGIAKGLEKELRSKRYSCAPLSIGSNTDPYQPIEKRYALMRDILEVLDRFNHPVAIVTKGTLVERDIDLLAPMAERGLVRVGISVTTLDADLSRRMEPRAPSPKRRLAIIRNLRSAGIPVRLMVSPIVPALTDPELEAIMSEGRAAGADAASWIMLRLPLEVSPLWRDWLEEHYPGRKDRVMARLREMHDGKDYSATWGHRMRGEGHYARLIGQRFELVRNRLGFDPSPPALRRDLFRVPELPGTQLSLF